MHARHHVTMALLIMTLLIAPGCGYNDIQGLDEETNAAWSEVLNQYQRRADLIPNLVNVVKGYAAHERQTLEAVTQARSGLGHGLQRLSLVGRIALDDIDQVRDQIGPPLILVEDLAPRSVRLFVEPLDVVIAASGCDQKRHDQQRHRHVMSSMHIGASLIENQRLLRLTDVISNTSPYRWDTGLSSARPPSRP